MLGNLIGGLLGGIAQPAIATPKQRFPAYRKHLVVTDGDAAYDTAAEVYALIGANTGIWTKVWQYTVPAQQRIRWGYGSPALPANQGYMWWAMLDVAAAFTIGILRLCISNAMENDIRTVMEINDEALHLSDVTTLATATPKDRNEMIALPEKIDFPWVGEDSKLQIWYKLISAGTEDAGGFAIPVTVQQVG